jgi:hypothetical protein
MPPPPIPGTLNLNQTTHKNPLLNGFYLFFLFEMKKLEYNLIRKIEISSLKISININLNIFMIFVFLLYSPCV